MTAHIEARVGIRRAVADDVDELVRLRRLMFDEQDARGGPDSWQTQARAWFLHALTVREDWMCVVAGDAPGDRLLACGTAWITWNLPGPQWPDGRKGYIAGMCTDVAGRRRGYARRVLGSLLDWLGESGVSVVELNSSPQGAPLYRSVGFVDYPLMRLHLSP
jgi:ribosomal protein S18 acetylase RimI-like enzyme